MDKQPPQPNRQQFYVSDEWQQRVDEAATTMGMKRYDFIKMAAAQAAHRTLKEGKQGTPPPPTMVTLEA